MEKLEQVLAFVILLLATVGCSSDSQEEYSLDDAQKVYNNLRGTYKGNVFVDNLPQPISFEIGDDFTVKYFPVSPILRRIFTDENEYQEAVASAPAVVYKAETDNLSITPNQVLLVMKQDDLIFSVSVGGKEYQVIAVVNAYTYKTHSANDLMVNMEVNELYCDGKSYDLSVNRLVYTVDSAAKVE